MELFFLAFLFVTMAFALGSGYPVAFSLPGAAIISIAAAALFGYLIESDSAAYFHSGSPYQWLSAGVTNLRFVYWDVERDTLIAIPLFIFMFVAAIFINAIFNLNSVVISWFSFTSNTLILAALFCIGAQIKIEQIRDINSHNFLYALTLWFFALVFSSSVIFLF